MRFGRFSMRSDPLLLAQIAEGKQRYVQFRCPRPRGTAVYFRTIVVRPGLEKAATRVGIDFIATRGARTYGRVSFFASVPSNLIAFTCARALTPTRGRGGTIGSVVQRGVRWPRRVGTRKSAGRKTTEEKTGHRYDLFVLIIIALIIARGERALASSTLFTHTRAHAWKRLRLHGQRGEGTATVRH